MAGFEKMGKLILKGNPYKAKPRNGGGDDQPKEERYEVMLDGIEVDAYEGSWTFKNAPNRIQKAVRIPYCYTDEDDLEVKDYLLIGYEGRGPG